jgi:hypothetical protein
MEFRELLAFIERNPIGSFLFGCALIAGIERIVHHVLRIGQPRVVQCDRKHVDDNQNNIKPC